MGEWLMNAKIILFIALCAFSFTGFSREEPKGFMWYNSKQDLKQDKSNPSQNTQTVAFKDLTPMQQRDVLVLQTRKALAKFNVDPTQENALDYIKWQHFWLNQTTKGKRAFQEAMLTHPEFNYSVTHPTSQIGTQVTDAIKVQRAENVIRQLSKTHGLLYFYRGSNPYDEKQADIIKSFSTRYNISLMPVSIDGVISQKLPESAIDKGQIERLKVKYFPAIMLFDAKTKRIKPVSYGFVTQDVIANQLLMVATNFKGDGL